MAITSLIQRDLIAGCTLKLNCRFDGICLTPPEINKCIKVLINYFLAQPGSDSSSVCQHILTLFIIRAC